MQTKMNAVLNDLAIAGTCVRAEEHHHLAFFDIRLQVKRGALNKLINNSTLKQIALAMCTKTVPIAKIIPDEGVVRLQVALREASPISFKNLICKEVIRTKQYLFPLLLGVTEEGTKFWMDMKDNPHLLIAGTTGSGKSTILHSLIANVLILNAVRSRNVFLYLADPKRVEFTAYKNGELGDIVQRLVSSYVEVLDMFEHLKQIMEERYEEMEEIGLKSVEDSPNHFPLLLCIVDEVADLLAQDKGGQLQSLFTQLAQKGRAAGIFITLATQRPSTDVITGLLKANFPGRLACKTSSRQDSLVILDEVGAEDLLGRGDAILTNTKNRLVRFQAAYTTPQDSIGHYKEIKQYFERKS